MKCITVGSIIFDERVLYCYVFDCSNLLLRHRTEVRQLHKALQCGCQWLEGSLVLIDSPSDHGPPVRNMINTALDNMVIQWSCNSGCLLSASVMSFITLTYGLLIKQIRYPPALTAYRAY